MILYHIVHDTQYKLETLTTGSAGLLVTGLVKQYVGLLLGVVPERQNKYQYLISIMTAIQFQADYENREKHSIYKNVLISCILG